MDRRKFLKLGSSAAVAIAVPAETAKYGLRSTDKSARSLRQLKANIEITLTNVSKKVVVPPRIVDKGDYYEALWEVADHG